MENKINIANLLKDCPSGMELDSPLFDDVHFDSIDEVCDAIKCYIQDSHHKIGISFNKYGCYSNISKSKCVIFPKGKTTWEGFKRPFKDGDILISGLADCCNPFIFKQTNGFGNAQCYCAINVFEELILNSDNWTPIKGCRLATEEEKQKLFDAIKANGYRWNPETKTLEKLPKFKVGDKIKHKDTVLTIITVQTNNYIVEDEIDNFGILMFSQQDKWELIPNKFDITALNPFDKVLVRDHNAQEWVASLFSNYNEPKKYKYICVNGSGYAQCIPYEENKHLLGTTNDCDEYFKTWE